tara:strand:+ start:362 stop:490 length:129 start_codon:yes stop_codon:yes gene_type:complete
MSRLRRRLSADIEVYGGEGIAIRIAACLNGFQGYEVFRPNKF